MTRTPVTPPRPLTPREGLFVQHLLADPEMNQTAAYRAAGFASRSPAADRSNASAVAARPKVQKLIREELDARASRLRITADRVLGKLAQMALGDPRNLFEEDGSLKLVSAWGDDEAAMIAGFEVAEIFDGEGAQRHAIGLLKKVKLVDRRASLELLGKNLRLFPNAAEVSGPNGGPIQTAPALDLSGLSDSELVQFRALLAKAAPKTIEGKAAPKVINPKESPL